MKAFYFANEDRKLRYGDRRPIVVGETHTVEGKGVLCENGLHASTTLMGALGHAYGPILYLVELSGDVVVNIDKVVASKRTYLAEFDATDVLRQFSKNQALINIEKIKPYCSAEEYEVITGYLNGTALESSARSAAESSASSAAESVWSAARLAESVWSARSAESAAQSAAWSAESSAQSAVWSAARSAARSAAESSARSAASSAARATQNEMLTSMIREATGWDI